MFVDNARVRELCELASKEKDSNKLLSLVQRLNRELDQLSPEEPSGNSEVANGIGQRVQNNLTGTDE